MKQHDSEIKKLQQLVVEHSRGNSGGVSLAKERHNSNVTRSAHYKQNGFRLPIDSLHRVLEIDSEQMVAIVEPRVSMAELAKATLKKGLIPLVVPEFKGITMGGAINGCGGESSSHKYGLVHDICPRMQLLLGNGEISWASVSENRDLYDAVGGSYGSLGVLLGCHVRLQRAHPWVNLTFHRYASPKEALQKLKELYRAKDAPEFLEGIIFSPTNAVIIEGRPEDGPTGSINRSLPWGRWYYQQVSLGKDGMSMPLYDYLFRHDRGAFWMGKYVLTAPLLAKLYLQGVWKLQQPAPFTKNERQKFARLKDPGALRRLFSFPFTSSQALFGVLHSCESWVAERIVIQDFTLPENTVEPFLEAVFEESAIYPLWLCPLKSSPPSQLFAPHACPTSPYSINIGVYGLPETASNAFSCLKELEGRLARLQGRKWLYTHSCYSPEQFWQIYPEKGYRELRAKYAADGMWLSIEQKVLTK